MKILILGGYGTFGGRLAQLLANDKNFTLMIAGRSLSKAQAFCETLQSAQATPLFFDRDADAEKQIREIKPDVVVDATGPFQNYGNDPYRIVKACLANSINYMDLADGSDFVKGISQFDSEAKAKNIYILAGVSSFPVLTAAVVRRLSRDFSHVKKITAGIAPSPYAGIGLNVIRAIASYAGKSLPFVRNGRKEKGYAFTETMRYTIAPPGYLPLNNIRFSLVDVPDLQVLPELWPQLDSIWMGAGPVPEMLHRMLNALAWLVRLKLLPSLSPFARLFYLVTNTLRWGEHRGGMFVSVEGLDAQGNFIERSWHLLAEGNDGPYIPSMAVEAILRRSLSGKNPAPGARPATRDLELEDYETIFKTKTIYTGEREADSAIIHEPLYKRILGSVWHTLPPQIQAMHNCEGELTAQGRAVIERGHGLFARVIAAVFRFPHAGKNIPLTVNFQKIAGTEIWRRTFGIQSFSSIQMQGGKSTERLLCEVFGPFTFGLALVMQNGNLCLITRRWYFLGLPLPRILAPNGLSFEHVEANQFCFHVEIIHPLIGLIVRYRGWLEIQEEKPMNKMPWLRQAADYHDQEMEKLKRLSEAELRALVSSIQLTPEQAEIELTLLKKTLDMKLTTLVGIAPYPLPNNLDELGCKAGLFIAQSPRKQLVVALSICSPDKTSATTDAFELLPDGKIKSLYDN